MELRFCPLFSGSSGNSLYLGCNDTHLLIDAGMSGAKITAEMERVGLAPTDLSGILITHEHADHIAGAGILSRRYNLPIYANEATWSAMRDKLGNISENNIRLFETGADFHIGSLDITPFAIPHDAAGPVGYRIFAGGHSVATATDMGYLTKDVLKRISGSDIVLLESNHDPDMLMQNPHYSAALKKRILGRLGHLSNESCAQGILKLAETGVRNVVLGHLSAENNTPELAMDTAVRAAEEAGLVLGRDLHIDMAWRDRVSNQ